MQKKSVILAAFAAITLSACLEGDAERGVAGAGAGFLGAQVLGTDPTGTAIAGAAIGVLCDDAGVRACR